jgi:Protein of unknown function (DUF2939)
VKAMRRLIYVGLVVGALGGAFVASPFLTAWTIREAIKGNDSGYLEGKIEWTSVRSTLKESLGKFAFTASGDMTEAPAKPGLWQRIKSYVGRGAVDSFVDTTVTPTGMAGLFEVRKAYQTTITGVEDPAKRPPIWERMRRVWSRVTRAEFARLDRFEMDMIDKQAPERTISCVLELRGFQWKMTELRVKATDPARVATIRPLLAMQ